MNDEARFSVNTVTTWAVGVCAALVYVLAWFLPGLPMLGTTAVMLTIATATLTVRGWHCRTLRLMRVLHGLEQPAGDVRPDPENLRRI